MVSVVKNAGGYLTSQEETRIIDDIIEHLNKLLKDNSLKYHYELHSQDRFNGGFRLNGREIYCDIVIRSQKDDNGVLADFLRQVMKVDIQRMRECIRLRIDASIAINAQREKDASERRMARGSDPTSNRLSNEATEMLATIEELKQKLEASERERTLYKSQVAPDVPQPKDPEPRVQEQVPVLASPPLPQAAKASKGPIIAIVFLLIVVLGLGVLILQGQILKQ